MVYSKGENGIVERANQDVLRHLTAILFDTRVSNAWSYEQLPMVLKNEYRREDVDWRHPS